MPISYSYQAEKFSSARRALMLPHSQGEAASIAEAFHEIALAFHRLDESGFDDNARTWTDKLREFINTEGVVDNTGEGLWTVKARGLSIAAKLELSRVVDELAHWFAEAGQD